MGEFNEPAPGWIFAAGGGEEKDPGGETLRRFLGVAGGRDARILVIESGGEKGRGPALRDALAGLGAAQADYLGTREEVVAGEIQARVAGATGFYLAGGDAGEMSEFLTGGSWGRHVAEAVASGVVLAASGGVAEVLGEFSVASGQKKSASPVKGFVSMRRATGLIPGVLFDNTPAPSRLTRLVAAVAQNPFHLGIGVDEETLALFTPEGVLEAYGAGSVQLVDGSAIGYSNYFALKDEAPVGVTGLRVTLLTEGMRFAIDQRSYLYPERERQHKRISAAAEARALDR